MLRTREIYTRVFVATAFRSGTGMRVSLRRFWRRVVCLTATLRCLRLSRFPTSGASVKVGLRWRRDNLLNRALTKKRLSKSRNLLFEMHMEMTGNKIINSYLTLAQQVYLNNLFTFINLINAVSHLQLLKVLTVNIYFPGRFIDQTTNN